MLPNKILTSLTTVYATETLLFYTEQVHLPRDKNRKKSEIRKSSTLYHHKAFLIMQTLDNMNISKSAAIFSHRNPYTFKCDKWNLASIQMEFSQHILIYHLM